MEYPPVSQLIFVLVLSMLYLMLENSEFINAVDVFRPGVVFVVCANLAGIVCAVRYIMICILLTNIFVLISPL